MKPSARRERAQDPGLSHQLIITERLRRQPCRRGPPRRRYISAPPAGSRGLIRMAIYGQPNSWTCGPFALKHGLLALGVFAREDDLARVAASTERHGTDEPGLRRAARAHGVELRLRRATEPHAAGEELRRWLASG